MKINSVIYNMKRIVGILVNDIHLDKDKGELVKDIFEQLIVLCKKYNTNNIFCGGDVFTSRSGQPLQCLTDFKEIIIRLQEEDITFHVIPGNHDKTDSNDERSYLDIYTSMENICLFRRAQVVRLDNMGFLFIPYFKDDKWLEEYNREDIQSKIKKLQSKGIPTILITHSGFDGVVNNDGSKVESAIKPSMFTDFTNVLIGHYHNASQLADNVIYTGSAYPNDFGENSVDKGCTLIYTDGSITHVPLKSPKYIVETLDVNDKQTLQNLLEKYSGETYDHIRFIFKGKKDEANKVNLAEIQGKYGIDCKFQATEEYAAMELSDEGVFEFDAKSIRKDFIAYCSENNIKGEKMSYGLALLKLL